MTIHVLKEDGTQERFSAPKLLRSLLQAGAPETLAGDIVRYVERDARDGMRTEDIYAHAFSILREEHRPIAAEYSLKRAIAELGPSGFPFEKFLGRILEANGYMVHVGVMVPGKCVTHEVDVVAEKDGEHVLIEAKFHNASGTKTDVKVALYVDARFRDITAVQHGKETKKTLHRAWLVTNTNFTTQAIAYGKCAGLMMTGWNYPKGETLQDLIQSARVHPVTCLTTLAPEYKRALLDRGAVLCKDVLGRKDLLKSLGLSQKEIEDIFEEGNALCTI